MAKRIMLVVGHSKDKQGASNSDGVTEYEFNKDIALKVLELDAFRGIDIIPKLRVTSYSNLTYEINAINPDIVISLHCNAYNKSAQGTEVLYAKGSIKGEKYARILQNNLVENLGLSDRGVKSIGSKDRGGSLLYGVKAPCILIEPLFIDAMTSGQLFDAQGDITDAIINSIEEMV